MELKDNLIGLEHVGVPTKDLAKTIAFYESLGFTVALRTAVPGGGNVAFLQLGNVMIETYESDDVAGKPGAIDHIALDTTDVEAAFAAAKEAGLTMLDDEIHGLPFWANGVKFFTVEGPNGEKVEFCQKL